MANQGFVTSTVGPMMTGYENYNTMGGYGATMGINTVAPVTTNSNSRVLITGNSNSRVIIAPPIYNKAVIAPRAVETRMEYIPYQTKEIVYDTVEKR